MWKDSGKRKRTARHGTAGVEIATIRQVVLVSHCKASHSFHSTRHTFAHLAIIYYYIIYVYMRGGIPPPHYSCLLRFVLVTVAAAVRRSRLLFTFSTKALKKPPLVISLNVTQILYYSDKLRYIPAEQGQTDQKRLKNWTLKWMRWWCWEVLRGRYRRAAGRQGGSGAWMARRS